MSGTDWTDQDYVVVDVEGNGHHPPDLVELGVVPIVGGIVGDPTSWLLRPDQPITRFATKIHGITNADVASAPVFRDIEPEVRTLLAGPTVVAHNAHIDVDVMDRKLGNWEPTEVFDTLKLARKFYPNLDSYKLGALVQTFELDYDLPPTTRPHRATYDALVTARLFLQLAGRRTLEELRAALVPNGRHNDTPTLF